jgi:hypothetical protein
VELHVHASIPRLAWYLNVPSDCFNSEQRTVWYIEVDHDSCFPRAFDSLFVINIVNCTSDVSRLKKEELCSSETLVAVLSGHSSASQR